MAGEEASPPVVHERLICEHSHFFNCAVKDEWKEGEDRRIPLHDDRPEVVALYVQWVYRDKILSHGTPTIAERDGTELDQLIDAFVFGEKI